MWKLHLLLLLYVQSLMLVMVYSHQCNKLFFKVTLKVELDEVLNDGSVIVREKLEDLIVSFEKLNIENDVFEFCRQHNINNDNCGGVFLYIMEQKKVECAHSVLEIHESIRNFDRLVSHNSTRYTIFNDPPISTETVQTMINSVEIAAIQYISSIISSSGVSVSEDMARVAFIHSCSLDFQNHEILIKLLDSIIAHDLISSMKYVFVLNYGNEVSSALQESYRTLHSNIHFIQVSRDVTFAEIPSLRILHRISTQFQIGRRNKTQILYLHTKGVGYIQPAPFVTEWTDMMLYFLVERHQSCFHLLSTGQFDAVGALYKLKTENYGTHFQGNFWWTTSEFLSRIPQPEYLEDKVENKRSAEFWLLNVTNAHVRVNEPVINNCGHQLLDNAPRKNVIDRPARIYCPHNTHLNLYHHAYPRHLYERKK